MPTFELQFAYQCPKCRKVNINTVVLAAPDEQTGKSSATKSIICARCKRHLTDHERLTTKVKEIS